MCSLRIARHQAAHQLLEAAGVRHEVVQRDRLAECVRVRDRKIQVLRDVAVEIELALLDQLHHRRVRHELRDRARAKQRALRVDGPLGRDVGVTVTLLREHLAVLHYDDDAASDIADPHRVGHEAVEPRLDVGARELGRRS